MRHICNKNTNGRDWQMCCVCDGRVHLPGCTTKLNKNRDCCFERHLMLYNKGKKVGLCDTSITMLTPYEIKVGRFKTYEELIDKNID